MKHFLIAIPALLAATGIYAQDNPPAPASPPASDAAAAKLTIETPIETLMADENAKAVVDANIPGIEAHPAYSQFKGMSLKQLQPFSQGMITDELLTKVEAGLAELG